MLAYFFWDPSPYLFNFVLPILKRPILWYGFLFALGFFLGYYVFKFLLIKHLSYTPFFSKEDILDRHIVAQRLNENKERLIDGYKERMPIFKPDALSLSRFLNEYINTASIGTKFLKRSFLETLLKGSVLTLGKKAKSLSEQVSFACILGAVIGARLFDLIFYQDALSVLNDPMVVFRVWEGGLSSHGGALGVMIALWITAKKKDFILSKISFLSILDMISIPTPLIGALIRIGNFINQEILGKPTDVPWAVIFGHPADGSRPVPRHPVQLYESFCYLALFIFMFFLWRKKGFIWSSGRLFGLFLSLLFCLRFFLEFFKEEQSVYLSQKTVVSMGQILSIPFILVGFILFLRGSSLLKKKEG